MKRIVFSAVALLIFIFVFTAETHAFIFISAGGFAKGNRPVSRAPYWSARSLTFVVNTNQSAYGGAVAPSLTSAEFLTAVQSAISSWSSVCGADINVVYGGTTTGVRDANDSVNSVSWDNNTVGGGSNFSSTSTLAFAVSSVGSTTDRYADCDIVVNGNAVGSFGINGEAAKYDLVGVLAHEIGHCLGLDHSVEPPTFTSNNPILLSATMASTVAAGNIEPRSISQDEKDGMECVNPKGSDFRTGHRCGSYHGTNGGAALSGTVVGGPSAELSGCGPGSSTAVSPSTEDASGCISSVFADERGKLRKGKPDQSPVWQIFAIVALGCALLRRKRRGTGLFLFLAAAMGAASPAQAAEIELGADYRFSKPALLNKATEISSNEGTFASKEGTSNFNRQWAFLGAARVETIPGFLSLGIGARYWNEADRELLAYDSANVLILTKRTAINGFVAGPTVRLSLFPFSTGVNISADAWLLFGSMSLTQTLTGLGSDNGYLEASAPAMEAMVNLIADCPLTGPVVLRFRAGYSYYRTGAFGIDSASGTRFSGFTEGKKLLVSDGGPKELRAVFTGMVFGVFLAFDF